MVDTGSPKWAEKNFRLAAYTTFIISMTIFLYTSYKKYVKDSTLDRRHDLAHKISLGTTPALIALLGFMMTKSASKANVKTAMQPHISKIQTGLSGLSSIR